MTVTRLASTLCPRDKGRTVEGEDIEGTPFTGELTGGDFAGEQFTIWIDGNSVEIQRDAWVQVTGAVFIPDNHGGGLSAAFQSSAATSRSLGLSQKVLPQ